MPLTTAIIQIAILFIVIANLVFLIIITLHVRRILKCESDRHSVMEHNILTLAEEVFRKLEYMNRWQKVLAKMVNDDRARLQDHDAKVEEMYRIARQLSEKFLKEP